MEEATYLANLKDAATIYMIQRRDVMRASKIMQERAKNHPNIEMVWNHVVDEVVGNGDKVTGLKLKSTVDDSSRELEVGGMFVAIGHKPNTDPFVGSLDLDDVGYVKVKAGSSYTSAAGVFAAGDVADTVYRQAVTAAGMGCMAALDAERWLAEEGHA